MKKDDLDYVIEALQKRDEILIKDKPVRQYNKYFDNMRKYARKIINDNRQAELLPFLDSDNISYRFDVAGLLYNCYPDIELLELYYTRVFYFGKVLFI